MVMTVIEATTMAVGTTVGMMIGVMTEGMIVVTMIDGMTAIAIVTIGTTEPFRPYLRARLRRALCGFILLPASEWAQVLLSNQAALPVARSA